MIPQQRLKTWKLHDSQRGVFAYELYKHMAENEDVYLLTGDLGFPMFNPHQDDFPDRYLNCGAAEQSMLDIAVGLAYAGKVPVCYSITPFLLYRGFETLRTYISHEKLNVKLVGGGRGSDYKHDGVSHFAGDDWMLFNEENQAGILQNIQPRWPKDIEEMKKDFDEAMKSELPYYLNLTR